MLHLGTERGRNGNPPPSVAQTGGATVTPPAPFRCAERVVPCRPGGAAAGATAGAACCCKTAGTRAAATAIACLAAAAAASAAAALARTDCGNCAGAGSTAAATALGRTLRFGLAGALRLRAFAAAPSCRRGLAERCATCDSAMSRHTASFAACRSAHCSSTSAGRSWRRASSLAAASAKSLPCQSSWLTPAAKASGSERWLGSHWTVQPCGPRSGSHARAQRSALVPLPSSSRVMLPHWMLAHFL
jgi:hypothetical protein